jgi:HEAT repeat protein
VRRTLTTFFIAALALPAATPTLAGQPSLAPGALVAMGNQDRFSLRAREVPPERLQLDVQAQTGLTIVAPLGKTVTVEFADLPAREGAARIGASLGGLVPLRASWANPAPNARFARVETHYLVRPGPRRRQLLDAFALEQGGVGHQRLFDLLKGEGAAVVPDAAAQARDASRAERERIVTIGLLGAIGGADATAGLTAILGAGPGTYVRRAAASALGAAGQPGSAPTLRAALADPDAGVALSAAWALVRLGDPSGVPLALLQLQGPEALAALNVIAATANPVHIPALEASLAGAVGLARLRIRTTIVDLSLAPLDEAGRIAGLERLLADPDFEMRRHGAKALAGLGTPAAEQALERAAAEVSRTAAGEAAEALVRLRRSRQPAPVVTIE